MNERGLKPTGYDGLFDPENYVVAGAVFVITEIMIEADLADFPCLEQSDCLFGPVHANPAGGGISFIIEEDPHISTCLSA